MSDYEILCSIRLGLQHSATGKTPHYFGDAQLPPATTLSIVKFPDDSGFYLLYLDADGNETTDTYHDTIEAAKDQANWEYGVKAEEWNAKTH